MAPAKRVIVVGLDGLEPAITDALLESGDLPHLAGLRTAGGYTRLATTTPAQTPVAWSTFATGVNPGGHGIFDFLRRDPATYLPDLALTRYEQHSAFLPPKAVNQRHGRTVWEVLSDAGMSSAVLRCPCTFPPDEFHGRMLSGMGVPDIRGGLGTSTFYSTAGDLAPRDSEQVVALVRDGSAWSGRLIGPRNPRDRADVTIPFRLETDAAGFGTISGDFSPREVRLEVGAWSDWVSLRFRVGLLTTVRGMVRLLLVRLSPHVELYASPVNFDPSAPMFPISRPPGYASELAATSGPFHTAGIAEDHTGLANGRLDEDDFLAQCDLVTRERESMLMHELGRQREGLLFCLFDTPDRIQHMFWRFRDPSHPANSAGEPRRPEWTHAIEDHYRRCDAIVGEVMRSADDRTLVIIASDHGFTSFRRGVGLNAWLHRHGYLALRDGVAPGPEAGEFFGEVDWGRTRAYALGFGGIYVNRKGREASGIVDPASAESLAGELAERITGLIDPDRGATAVLGARTRASLYAGPYANESPDLVVEFAHGYRASWTTALGGIPAALFEDNTRKWAGDHIVAPELVPGVLFMNRAFAGAGARMMDLAPTILGFLGVPVPVEYEGRQLLVSTDE